MWFIIGGLACMGLAAFLILRNFNDNLVFFFSPTELMEKHTAAGKRVRVGGLVQAGTVTHPNPMSVEFIITDLKHTLTVHYTGMLPTLFREGQGVVAEGALGADGIFKAEQILAKHDERYMPPEVEKALKASGHWNPEKGGVP